MMTITELKFKAKLEGNMFTLVYGSWLNWDKLPGRLSRADEDIRPPTFHGLFSPRN
jgi:hypothetical protein